jgi:cytochrome P450
MTTEPAGSGALPIRPDAVLRGPDAVLAALTSADLTVPPASADTGPPSLGWLRAHVARFSSGPEHARRRGAATNALATVDLDALRDNAFRRTRDILAAGAEVDLMAEVARTVPVTVLAEALGCTAGVADVALVAGGYLTGPADGEPTDAVDAAVARLAAATGRGTGEDAAAVVGLLVQAYEATAGLIGNACLAALRNDHNEPAERVVERTLREDPPTLATRRLATVDTVVEGVHIGAGEVVRIDLASAGRTLGGGPHACPGAPQARAITAGVVEAVRPGRLHDDTVTYVPSANLRVPARLMVST